MLCYSTTSNLKLKKFLWRTKWFLEKSIHNITNSDNPSNYRSLCKNFEATLLFVTFSKAFDSIHKEQMKQIFLVYGLPKETIATIMMLNKIMKVKVHSPDGDTDSFDIDAGFLQGDTLAPYLFIICLDCVFWRLIDLMKENGFTLEKVRRRRYPV